MAVTKYCSLVHHHRVICLLSNFRWHINDFFSTFFSGHWRPTITKYWRQYPQIYLLQMKFTHNPMFEQLIFLVVIISGNKATSKCTKVFFVFLNCFNYRPMQSVLICYHNHMIIWRSISKQTKSECLDMRFFWLVYNIINGWKKSKL